MKRPTEFVPVYDQSKRQAAEMMEELFVENERLRKERDEANAESLANAELIGKDTDRMDKLVMEKRGLETRLEWANGLLDEVDRLLGIWTNPEWDDNRRILEVGRLLAKRKGAE